MPTIDIVVVTVVVDIVVVNSVVVDIVVIDIIGVDIVVPTNSILIKKAHSLVEDHFLAKKNCKIMKSLLESLLQNIKVVAINKCLHRPVVFCIYLERI